MIYGIGAILEMIAIVAYTLWLAGKHYKRGYADGYYKGLSDYCAALAERKAEEAAEPTPEPAQGSQQK
jgi:hypothetical protein